jgi:hypothetical protein
MKKSMKVVISAFLGALSFISASANANLVTNGGFETGNFSGWALGGNTGFISLQGSAAHSGNFGFHAGPVGSDGTLSQTLTTAAGATYELDFWLRNDNGPVNDFTATIDGNQALALTNSSSFSYTHVVYDFVASSNSTVLQFAFRQDPSFWDLDDVAVNAVPEPATLGIFGLSLLGLGAVRRRKQ